MYKKMKIYKNRNSKVNNFDRFVTIHREYRIHVNGVLSPC